MSANGGQVGGFSKQVVEWKHHPDWTMVIAHSWLRIATGKEVGELLEYLDAFGL
jgi:hypothetical protein